MNCTKDYRIKITSNLPTPVLWWKMEEAAASDRIDQVVGAVLNQANSPSQAPGKINNCAKFDPPAGNSDGMVGTGPSWPYAGGGLTVVGWFLYENETVSNTQLIFKIKDAASFFTGIQNDTADASFHLNATAGGDTMITTPTPAVWHFFVMEYSGGVFSLEFDRNGTIFSVASPSPALASNITLYCACGNGGGGALTWSIDEVGVFDGLLTSAQKDSLYNSGAGVTYPY